jgi:hypothetical protein
MARLLLDLIQNKVNGTGDLPDNIRDPGAGVGAVY